MTDKPDAGSGNHLDIFGCLAILSRVFSLLLAVTYVLSALAHGTPPASFLISHSLSFLFPLAIIWFPRQIRNHVCSRVGGWIARELTPLVVALTGWALFMGLPVLIDNLPRLFEPS